MDRDAIGTHINGTDGQPEFLGQFHDAPDLAVTD
jgi:hypothetical protein